MTGAKGPLPRTGFFRPPMSGLLQGYRMLLPMRPIPSAPSWSRQAAAGITTKAPQSPELAWGLRKRPNEAFEGAEGV